jgi:ParB-like chromosome segregation protein Spo0J
MPNTLLVPISQLRLNDENPRLLKEARFKQLVNSIQAFPQMLQLRPCVVDETYTVLGGNMRLRALQHLGYTQVPVILAEGLTQEQKREFIIKDNASFGEWDWDALANEWSELPLAEWGVDLPASWTVEATEDYADKNKEVNLDDLEEKLEFKLKLTSDQFFDLQERLSVVKAKQNADTNEEALFALLDFYEARA